MKRILIGLTFMLAAAGTTGWSQPLALPSTPGAPANIIAVGCAGSADQALDNSNRQVRRDGNCDPNAVSSASGNSRRKGEYLMRRYNDCHRDVRTHRIYGVLVKHRHVGEDCAVREVRTVN